MPEAFWSVRLPDILNAIILLVTIWAIIYGPAHAVEITRRQDAARDAVARKRRILSTLMRTRKVVMNPDHVGALNEIQLEFSEDHAVISAYRAYIANLSDTVPAPGNDLDNFLKRRGDLFLIYCTRSARLQMSLSIDTIWTASPMYLSAGKQNRKSSAL
jgi:hypothetical protein